MTLVILLVIALALFGLSYISKRRFGILGLGLAAGVVLTDELARVTADILERNQLPVAPLSYQTAASVLLTLLPAILLLTGGPTYHKQRSIVLGSIAFGVLATLLVVGPLTVDLPTLDSNVKQVLDMTATWQSAIISVGIVVSVIDVMLAHGPKLPGKRAKH